MQFISSSRNGFDFILFSMYWKAACFQIIYWTNKFVWHTFIQLILLCMYLYMSSLVKMSIVVYILYWFIRRRPYHVWPWVICCANLICICIHYTSCSNDRVPFIKRNRAMRSRAAHIHIRFALLQQLQPCAHTYYTLLII